ncbi:MAG: hypothetical protein ACRD4P_13920, partial [Bryobacteraceae bacterium]
ISPQEHPYPYESKLSREGDRLVYHEDFADPKSGWPFNDSSWYGSSEYHIVRNGPVDLLGEGLVRAYGPWWTDVRASVSVKPPAAARVECWTTSSAAGLVFRLNDQGYYALLISAAPGVHAKLIAKRFNVPRATDLMPWTRVDETRPIGAGEWDRLQVECRGDVIALSVNGREIGKVRDGSFPDGYVGMTLFGPGHAVFRDLVAEEKELNSMSH